MNLESIPGGRMARLPKGIDLLAASGGALRGSRAYARAGSGYRSP